MLTKCVGLVSCFMTRSVWAKAEQAWLNPWHLRQPVIWVYIQPYTTRDCWSEVQKARYLCGEFQVSCISLYMFHVVVNRIYMPGFMFPVAFLKLERNWASRKGNRWRWYQLCAGMVSCFLFHVLANVSKSRTGRAWTLTHWQSVKCTYTPTPTPPGIAGQRCKSQGTYVSSSMFHVFYVTCFMLRLKECTCLVSCF